MSLLTMALLCMGLVVADMRSNAVQIEAGHRFCERPEGPAKARPRCRGVLPVLGAAVALEETVHCKPQHFVQTTKISWKPVRTFGLANSVPPRPNQNYKTRLIANHAGELFRTIAHTHTERDKLKLALKKQICMAHCSRVIQAVTF